MTLTGVREAVVRPLWFDEVFTAIIAARPLSEVFATLRTGADTSGPGYYVLLHALMPLADDMHLALRLPSILATSGAAWAVYAFARRDLPGGPSLIALAVVAVSQLYHGYSVEARPYALLACGSAVSLLAWQRADRWRWTVVLFASVAASVTVHYYAVFTLVPLALGEVVLTALTRRWRWRVWAAFGSGAAALAALWPQLAALRAYYGDHYWSVPSIGKALVTYDTVSGIGVPGVGLGVALVLALALVALLRAVPTRSSQRVLADAAPRRAATLTLLLAMIALPAIIVASTWMSGGGFAERYALAVVVGLALAAAYVAAATVNRRHQPALAAVVVVVFLAGELAFWGDGAVGALRQGPSMRGFDEMADVAATAGVPLVVANGLDFLPYAYYHPGAADSIVSLTDEDVALRLVGTNSIERDLAVIRGLHPLRVEALVPFVDEHREFHLLTRPGPYNWTLPWLLERGYVLTVARQSGPFTLYSVRRGGL